jgi:NADH-quinone oxidoreductase subunit E
MSTGLNETPAANLLAAYDRSRQNLIPILQDVQTHYGYLPQEVMDRVAEHLQLSVHDVYGVATFYSQFRFHPPGKHCLKVCQGTACHVRGSEVVLDALSRRLGILPGQTTPDREYTLERVMCVGSCALAPAVVVDDTVHGRMTQAKIDRMLSPEHAKSGRAGVPVKQEKP